MQVRDRTGDQLTRTEQSYIRLFNVRLWSKYYWVALEGTEAVGLVVADGSGRLDGELKRPARRASAIE